MSDGILAMRAETARIGEEVNALRTEAFYARDRAEEIRIETGRVHDMAARAARRATLQRDRIRVLFLVHNRDAWDSIGELISILRTDQDFDPVVLSIPHHYAGHSAPHGERRVHEFLADLGVPHLRLRKRDLASATELMLAIDPDIVFRQSQWDADIDPAFSAERLAWTRLAIVPYETMNPTRNVPWGDPPVNSALDQRLHRAAWFVFCANEEVMHIAREETLTGARQFRVVGHPKADALRNTVPTWPLSQRTPRRRRVMWSAHHSILDGWNDFGVFASVKDDMLRWATEQADTEFVFTHHPHLPGTIRRPGGPLSSEQFNEWLAAWQSLPNASYARGPYAPLLAAADALITDGPSMMTESQVLGVPTIFLERANHIPFNTIGEIIATGVHRVADVAGARAVMSAVADGDPLADAQRENVESLFGPPGAAQRIVEIIRGEAVTEARSRR